MTRDSCDSTMAAAALADLPLQLDVSAVVLRQAPNLQYLHEMTSSVGNFFMCRRRDCLYYSWDANWVDSADKELFMRPACGNKCSSWGEQPGPHLWTA